VSLPPEYQERLEALRRVYFKQLPLRAARIQRTFARARQKRYSQKALESLHMLVHRLAGSAAIHRAHAVGAVAGRLELLLLGALEAPAACRPDERRLAALVSQLARACHVSSNSGPRRS
jgi:HPt (histidine-containing phosphotransfer) domain-containing protein